MRCLGHAREPRDDGGLEGPGEYDDDPRCYAVFARDPDGMKVEVLHVTPGAPAA